jgi:hypothetical protein
MEPESPLKASAKAQRMGLLKAAQTTAVPTKALPKEVLKLSAKAQTRGFLKAARTLMSPAKASRKERLKADPNGMELGKMMALMKAPRKLTVSVKEPTKAGPTTLGSRPMASQKVWTMAEPTERESPPKTSAKAQRMGSLKAALTATVPAKASRKEALKVDWHQRKFPRWHQKGGSTDDTEMHLAGGGSYAVVKERFSQGSDSSREQGKNNGSCETSNWYETRTST